MTSRGLHVPTVATLFARGEEPAVGSHEAADGRSPARAGAGQRASLTALAARDLGSARILLAAGDASARHLIDSVLHGHGYDVLALPDRSDILAALAERAVDIVVLEAGGRDAEDRDALAAIRGDRRYVDVPVLLLPGAARSASSPASPGRPAAAALPPGAADAVPGPVEPLDLIARVRTALRVRRSLLCMEAAHQVVASLVNEMLPEGADIRSHTERLGTYAAELGRRVGLSATDLHAVAYATLLHDLAKLVSAEPVLTKPGPLTEEEMMAMRRHTDIGERIAAPLVGADRFGPILRHHHERWDGQGYPNGLREQAIPMGARIIAIVDAFDAMTQARPYRSPISVPAAVGELRRGAGSQFDPDLVDSFVEVLRWDGLI